MQVNTNIARKAAATQVQPTTKSEELRRYFEPAAASLEATESELVEMSFGEFLVEQGVLDRFQLFRALQLQDRMPSVRLGECAAALGYAPITAIERLYERYAKIETVLVSGPTSMTMS